MNQNPTFSRQGTALSLGFSFTIVFSLAIAVLLGGCFGEPPATGEESESIVVAYAVDIQGVNELITESTTITNMLIYFACFLELVEEQPDYQEGPPSFEPRLAESYEFSEDRLELTFRLRPGLVWSDGVPITAEDVRWTWQAQTHPAVGWSFIEAKQRIKDVEV
ncbi:MAG: ABC transporter substrate-binding protein, partial [Acidobacteriota bacterium]